MSSDFICSYDTMCESTQLTFKLYSNVDSSIGWSVLNMKEDFEDTKGLIRIGKSKKNRQHNGKKKKDKRTNNDLLNIHIKLKIEEYEPH